MYSRVPITVPSRVSMQRRTRPTRHGTRRWKRRGSGTCSSSARSPTNGRHGVTTCRISRRVCSGEEEGKTGQEASYMKLAIIGYGNVGRALARLLRAKRKEFPFTITGIHTLRHGTAADAAGLADKVTEAAEFGPPAASVEEFLDAARAQVAVELTTLNQIGRAHG